MTDDLMTDETTDYDETTDGPPEPVQTPDADQAAETPTDEPDDVEADEDTDDTKPGREAAKYRRRLRETEAERDELAAQLDGLRQTVAESIATANDGGRLRSGEVLWLSGAEVSALLDDDGRVDRAKVLAACDEAANRLGLPRSPQPSPVQGASLGPGNARPRMEDVVSGRSVG